MNAPVAIGPLAVRANRTEDEIAGLVGALAHPAPTRVAFANTHLLYHALRDRVFARLLTSFLLLNDGIGLALMARVAANRSFPENLNGTDFTPALLRALPAGTSLYLAGGAHDVVAAAAAHILAVHPHLEVCGFCDGYEGAALGQEEIVCLKPDVVLVAMGNPLQERWIDETARRTGRGLFLAVGALFDFLTERQPRAPRAWRRLHLEWSYRLLREPQRLWRRYSVEILYVFAAALRQRFASQP